jgi:hypothetical protein
MWKHVHPEFLESLKLGKETADRRVEQSLCRRAVGYSYDAVKIMGYEGEYTHVPYVEHVPPDTTACIFRLKNRRRQDWRDRIDHETKIVRAVTTMTDDELADIIRREQSASANKAAGSGNGVAEPKEVSAMLSTPRAPPETTTVPAAGPPTYTSTRLSRG